MVKVFYDSSAHRLTVSGHAGTAPRGEDLVCAAVTALAATLACNVQAFEDHGAVEEMHIEIEDGIADISCKPSKGYGAMVAFTYETICMGFAQLAAAHPGNVEYRWK